MRIGLLLSLCGFVRRGGNGNGASENLTDESTNILTDESGGNLLSSGA